MFKFIMLSMDLNNVREVETSEEAAALAEQFATDNPGKQFRVYQLVSESYGEPPVKVAAPVSTKDVVALETEAAANKEAKKAKKAQQDEAEVVK